MKGLIIKDLLIIKQNLRTLLIMLILFAFLALKGDSSVTYILPFLSVMLFINTFSYDEYNNFDAYAISMPISKKKIIASKYLTTFILITICSLISLAVSIGINYGSLDLDKIFSELIGSLAAVLLIVIVMYPFIFKFGVQKARIALFVVVFSIFGLVTLLFGNSSLEISKNVEIFINNYGYVLIPILILLFLGISYKASEKIYLKKEF